MRYVFSNSVFIKHYPKYMNFRGKISYTCCLLVLIKLDCLLVLFQHLSVFQADLSRWRTDILLRLNCVTYFQSAFYLHIQKDLFHCIQYELPLNNSYCLMKHSGALMIWMKMTKQVFKWAWTRHRPDSELQNYPCQKFFEVGK